MKSMIISTLCALLVTLQLQAQVCSTSLNLTSQAEVDAVTCTSVTGEVIISGTDITNLDNLSSMTSLGGSLFIGNTDMLTEIDGLSQLESIGGGLSISNNGMLTEIDGLSQLESIGGGLFIGYNDMLTDVDGLSQLDSLGGFLFIGYNDMLTDVDGLSQLDSIGGSLIIEDNVMLDRYCGLYTVLSAPAPEGLMGSFTISGNLANPTEQDILDLGAACPVAPDVEIPTMGEWGLMIVGLFIVIFGVIGIRRREVRYGV